jgi:hypothetical protein
VHVGRAGTLDLFKLYDETLSGSTGYHTELSRILIKFDVGRARALATSSLDVNASSFRAKLRLQSIESNLPVPRDFTVSIFPLARAFDEGDGRDVSGFSDIDTCNYLNSSAGVLWSISGAYASGALGDTGIDYYASGNLSDGLGLRSLESKQTFKVGNEDLFVDVTDVMSATIAGVIPDYGLLLSFTSSQETDTTTRFVKRFASRHVTLENLRPRLEIHSNDSINDAHASSFFDVTGSLYLRNFAGSSQLNLVSSSQEIVGANCLRIVLSTGSFSTTITASQQMVGSTFVTGSYLGSFCISAQNSTAVSGSVKLSDHISSTGSVVFSEKWQSIDGSVIFASTFLTCSLPARTTFDAVPRQLRLYTTNARQKYNLNQSYRIRSFAYDSNYEPSSTRVPKPTKSASPETYYRVRDLDGKVYIPFERNSGGTKLSVDSGGMFFDLHTDGLPRGRLLTLDYLVIDRGSEYIVEDKNVRFTVE